MTQLSWSARAKCWTAPRPDSRSSSCARRHHSGDSASDSLARPRRLCVGDLLTFQARLLACAPRSVQRLSPNSADGAPTLSAVEYGIKMGGRPQAAICGGCAALVAELDWFGARPPSRPRPDRGGRACDARLPRTPAAARRRTVRGCSDGAVGDRTGLPARVDISPVGLDTVRRVQSSTGPHRSSRTTSGHSASWQTPTVHQRAGRRRAVARGGVLGYGVIRRLTAAGADRRLCGSPCAPAMSACRFASSVPA